MNISEIEVQNIRPNTDHTKIIGSVTFHISGGVGDRCDVMSFECRCDMPTDATVDNQMIILKHNLKTEAIRQAKRMPEFRSGKEVLVFLQPNP